MQWTYAYKCALPDPCFAFIEGDVRKLPIFDAKGRLSVPHVRNALARLSQTDLPSAAIRQRIHTKLAALLERAHQGERVTNKGWQPVRSRQNPAPDPEAAYDRLVEQARQQWLEQGKVSVENLDRQYRSR